MNGDQPPNPLLVLAAPRPAERIRARPFPPDAKIRRPTARSQAQRLSPQFRTLQDNFEARRAQLLGDIAGAEPEQVLVLETVGTVQDFVNAVRQVEGLEFLGEFDEEDIPADEYFYDERGFDRPLRGTVYLVMTNQEAMEQLLSLWRQFTEDPTASLEHGLNRFREVFRRLHDIRPWGPEDRVRDTGVLDDWQQRAAEGQEVVPAEIELWFRDEGELRRAAEEEVRTYLTRAGGVVVTAASIPEIRYHAMLVQLPIAAVEPLFEAVDAVELIRSDRVMLLRPTGQGINVPDVESDELSNVPALPGAEDELGDPVVALLDGVPLEGHAALAGQLVIDDPDGWTAQAPARQRQHGTAMASLIVHGDGNVPQPPLERRLYVRPILVPENVPEWVSGRRQEKVPDNVLVVDLMHRAMRRIHVGEAGQDAKGPDVRIVNLSVGDAAAPFVRTLSAWARLLDWAAWTYGVLIVVSAGNHGGDLEVACDSASLRGMSADEIQQVTLGALAGSVHSRRLLPPAEGVNVLTVGASHADESVLGDHRPLRELITSPRLLAPFSAVGTGFRRAIKPDLLMPGGRLLYEVQPGSSPPSRVSPREAPTSPPGHLVASPLAPAGEIGGTAYWAGTSNAAALATRVAAQLHEVLDALRDADGGGFLDDQHVFVSSLRALLVHGASHGEASTLLRQAVSGQVSGQRFREYASRFVGYGRCDPDRLSGSTAERVTMVGGGDLGADEAAVFEIPLPPSLSGRVGRRRLVITLAWLTPTNPRDRRYRRARLWFDPPTEELRVTRDEADHHAVRRGTVQHEILEGDRAVAFADGDVLEVQVNCAAEAGKLDDRVPYALVVTLEVAPDIGVDVFTEVRERIRPMVEVRPTR